jgi:hypothetical protein
MKKILLKIHIWILVLVFRFLIYVKASRKLCGKLFVKVIDLKDDLKKLE